jgi:penicillin-binding protein 1A
VGSGSAYLIRDLLRDSMQRGTAAAAALADDSAFGKTGTSSQARDAWFAGGAGNVVAVVWVGLDVGAELGLSGAAAAAPIWKEFMQRAAQMHPVQAVARPRQIVERWIQVDTGLLVSRSRSGTERELFRRRALPPKRRLFRKDRPLPLIE